MEIRFCKPPFVGGELEEIQRAIESGRLSGDNRYTKLCQKWFDDRLGTSSLLTPSCTHALEMTALLLDIQPNDEVIMPSYTFVSTANAFVLRGARIVFVDIKPETMNIDPALIEDAITERTRAIVCMHYAGVVCEMDEILSVCSRHSIPLIEDAAQAIGSTYKMKAAGSFGSMSAFSFHETKNVTAGGEGGLLAVNRPELFDRAEVIREKGTNRSKFFKGEIDKYTWVGIGSSYLPSEIQAAYLYAQLNAIDTIQNSRMNTWNTYRELLTPIAAEGRIALPGVPPHCEHNAHMFYIKLESLEDRSAVLDKLRSDKISAVFHYIPLHTSPCGLENGRFHGQDVYTTRESERILRLPLWYNMKDSEISFVVERLAAALK